MSRRALVLCAAAATLLLAIVLARWSDVDVPPVGQEPGAPVPGGAGELEPASGVVRDMLVRRNAGPAEDAHATAPSPAVITPPVTREAAERMLGLFVRVTREGMPSPGESVQLFSLPFVGDEGVFRAEVARGLRLATRTATTDGRGFAVFLGRFGNGALVAVACEGGVVMRKAAPVRDLPSRCDLELGSGGVDGVVHGERGEPLVGVVVAAGGDTYVGEQRWIEREATMAVTDGRGRFALRGLPCGLVDVWCDPNVVTSGTARCRVRASVPRPAFVRFGAVPGAGWWRGRVVDSAGATVPGLTALRFVDSHSGEQRHARTGIDGRFEVLLPPGTWNGCALHGGGERADDAGEPSVTASIVDGVPCDLNVPCSGCRVLLALQRADAEVPLALAELSLVLELAGRRIGNRPPIQWRGGTWMVWNGLDAGVYRLRSDGPLVCVGEPAGGFTLDLTGPASLVQLDAVLARR